VYLTIVVVAYITQHLMVGCSAKTVLERMWKDAVLAKSEVLLWHLPERSEKKKPNPSQDKLA
jgi:hypothetical protein